MPVERCVKQLMFNDDKYRKVGRPTPTLLEQVLKDNNCSIDVFVNSCMKL